MSDDPPPGWVLTTLEKVVDVLDSKRVPVKKSERDKRPGNVPYFGATGQAGWIDKPIFNEELLLLGEDGAPFLDPVKRKAYIIDGPAWVNNHAHVLRAITDLATNKFLKYQLDWLPYEDHVTGTTRLKLTQRAMRQLPVLLPAVADQERIVAAIEEHFSRLDAVDARLASAVLRTTRLLQRVVDDQLRLVDARGQLLSELLTESLANGRSVPTAPSGGDPVLRLTAIKEGFIDPAETKQGAFGDTDPNRFAIAPDDFLISRGNGSLRLVGRGGLVSKGAPPVAFPDTMIRARVDESRLSPRYLSLVWHSRKVRRQLESQARTTAGIYKVNQSMIGAIELPVPPLDIQRQLVRVADEAGHAVASCVDSLDRCQAKAAALRRSILSRAFSGQLVPKSPGDEPASD